MSGHDFRTALVGGLIGALLIGVLTPVGAAVGDALRLGQVNTADAITTIKGSSGATLKLVQNDSSGRPIKLKGPGKHRWVRYLNADRVDRFHANGLVRVAHVETTNVDESVFGGTDSGDILSTQITAPASGLLFIVGGADSWVNGSGAEGDHYACQIQLDNTTVVGSHRMVRVASVDGIHTYNDEENCSTSGVKEVTPGTHTLDLRVVDRSTVNPRVYFSSASLQVLFVPFGADGTQPSL